jgi:hypothetical protein
MADGCRTRRILYVAFEGCEEENESRGQSSAGNADAMSQEGLTRKDLKG